MQDEAHGFRSSDPIPKTPKHRKAASLPPDINLTETASEYEQMKRSYFEKLRKRNCYSYLPTDLPPIIHDQTCIERKDTLNAFLKKKDFNFMFNIPENSHIKAVVIPKNVTLERVQSMSKATREKLIQINKKRGVMYTNELWSKTHYAKMVRLASMRKNMDREKLKGELLTTEQRIEELDEFYKKRKRSGEDTEVTNLLTKYQEKSSRGQTPINMPTEPSPLKARAKHITPLKLTKLKELDPVMEVKSAKSNRIEGRVTPQEEHIDIHVVQTDRQTRDKWRTTSQNFSSPGREGVKLFGGRMLLSSRNLSTPTLETCTPTDGNSPEIKRTTETSPSRIIYQKNRLLNHQIEMSRR